MVRDSKGMPVKTAYSEEKDIEFLTDDKKRGEHRVYLEPGMAAIFFPEDSHKPSIAQNDPAKVRKMVVKVAV